MSDPAPLPLQRQPKQTLHHVWAPKLGRPVVLNSRSQLHLWAMLEANPAVSRYCERPCPATDDEPVAADFWAVHDGRPTWLSLADAPQTSGSISAGPGVVMVSGAELDTHRVWIQNWLSLLPYLSSAAALNLVDLRSRLVEFFAREASLAEAEHHFAAVEPVLVRTATIEGLHRGQLLSPDLRVSPWTPSMRIHRR
jgi:hypothetical protein